MNGNQPKAKQLVANEQATNEQVAKDQTANEQVKKMSEDKYSLYMGKSDKPCPSLSEWKCSIYDNKNRPKVCAEYPLF